MQTNRILSVDAFRGFTIAAMILVNNPGDWGYVFGPLLHAEWNGLTPTDLIFPFFLFIVGISISLAYSKKLESGANKPKLVQKILWRSVKIFLIGLALNFIHVLNLADLRIVGVLQRIAIVFMVCSLLFLFSGRRIQIITAVSILLAYFLAMVLIPIPGYGKAMLEPGINLAAWVDSYLVPGKMWQITWDPEGFFSTLPAIATGIFGMLIGSFIHSKKAAEQKMLWIYLIGFAALAIGYMWSWVFPINKNLWTSSFVLVTGGLACLTLASFMFLIDFLANKRLAQAGIIFGANAITIYVMAELGNKLFYQLPFGQLSLSGHFMQLFSASEILLKTGSFLYALFYIAVLFIPALILYRRKIFIRL